MNTNIEFYVDIIAQYVIASTSVAYQTWQN